ncbi:hypothetical protein [Epilithonimonas sp.]|nr:hypothetical protein [Epilithonimonas sp.]
MPEGPTIVLMKEKLSKFVARKITGKYKRRSFYCETDQKLF